MTAAKSSHGWLSLWLINHQLEILDLVVWEHFTQTLLHNSKLYPFGVVFSKWAVSKVIELFLLRSPVLILIFLDLTRKNSILLHWLRKRQKWEQWKKILPLKIIHFGLRDLWKGLFVSREVRGWCHECHFLHHEGRRVSSKSPEWCKKWHEWHHPLT